MLPLLRALLLLVLSTFSSCGGGGGGGTTPAGLLARHPIDGQFDFAALPVAPQQATLELFDGLGAGNATGRFTTVRWVLLNDDRDLYLALEWDDATHDHDFDLVQGPLDFDGVKLAFDDDGDGLFEAGEAACTLFAASVSSQFVDQHGTAGDETDRIGDGRGRLAYDAGLGLYRAELLLPLADDDAGEDGPLDASSRYTFALLDHVRLATLQGDVASLHGVLPALGADASGWDALPLVAAGPHVHPAPPAGLGGLIAFVSRHEVEKGEVYVFDPGTGVVTRVTNDPTRYKDNVSLSHDRARIAYHASPAVDQGADYEIWAVDVDGTDLVQLTSNAILDGHPAWSPDDQRIAYASQRNGTFHVVLMTAAGVELDDLTPNGVDDNDPDWLADGRIVFKTDRFSTQPEVRIAVMDDDGTDVQQLSFVAGVSDHDCVGAGEAVLFERFLKGTDYTSDVEAGFTPWDLVLAPLDLSGERTLLHDPWINWLPVTDPSGRWVAHVKTLGYSEVRLIDLDGRDHGRLIPGITRVSYLDWK